MNILVSIITVSYNSALTINDTIQSVLNQTYTNIEYILIDGNSKDNTVEIIKSYKQKFKNKGITYKWISEPDKGIYDAMNKGIAIAKGDWISFIGSDDIYLINAISNYTKYINRQKLKDYDFVYSNVKLVDGNKEVKVINGVWSWKIFRRYMNIAHVGSLHNKRYFEKYGVFNESFKIAGDYELLLRAQNNLKTYKLDKITAFMAVNGVSNKNINRVFIETFKAKMITRKISIYYCYFDYCLAYFKYYIKKVLNEVY